VEVFLNLLSSEPQRTAIITGNIVTRQANNISISLQELILKPTNNSFAELQKFNLMQFRDCKYQCHTWDWNL